MEELRKNPQILTRSHSKHNNTTRRSRYQDAREGGLRLIRGGVLAHVEFSTQRAFRPPIGGHC
jgi:hypothetical protein